MKLKQIIILLTILLIGIIIGGLIQQEKNKIYSQSFQPTDMGYEFATEAEMEKIQKEKAEAKNSTEPNLDLPASETKKTSEQRGFGAIVDRNPQNHTVCCQISYPYPGTENEYEQREPSDCQNGNPSVVGGPAYKVVHNKSCVDAELENSN